MYNFAGTPNFFGPSCFEVALVYITKDLESIVQQILVAFFLYFNLKQKKNSSECLHILTRDHPYYGNRGCGIFKGGIQN